MGDGDAGITVWPSMKHSLMKFAIRTWFGMTSRKRASTRIQKMLARYLMLSQKIHADCGSIPITVPAMPGVDEDMRNWSFYMLLEHHAIVNVSITSIMESLVQDRQPTGAGAIDPKYDVLPTATAGPEKIDTFQQSIRDHLASVSNMDLLRGTSKKPHTLFGDFDAHYWHCMLGFHLMVHYKQAQLIIQRACIEIRS